MSLILVKTSKSCSELQKCVEVDKKQYDAAMAALVDCKLEDLSFLNHEIGVYEEVK